MRRQSRQPCVTTRITTRRTIRFATILWRMAQPWPAGVVAAPQQAAPFGLALPHIAPYPNNKGDEDGLSEDQDDCNKGCIDGNGAN